MIGKRAENTINRAVNLALSHQHEYFTLEHVLLALIEESEIAETIRACGGDPKTLKLRLEQVILTEVPKTDEGTPPVATLAVQRLIQRALFQVQSSGRDEIRPVDLFVAIFQAKDSYALHRLEEQGVQRLDVLNYVSHGIPKGNESSRSGEGSEEEGESESGPKSSGGEDPLKMYAPSLNERASSGGIDPLHGRTQELDRMIQTLCRRRKNNPLLVGEAGVGKTALAEGLALRIVKGDVPEPLKKAVVYALDLGSLIAGAKFRGDFEQRLKRVLQALDARRAKGEQPILFIDEIHTMIGAGSVGGGTLDAANLLKPLLSQGSLRCIGSTTYQEFRNVFEKDAALTRRFQKIDINEPSAEEAMAILRSLQGKYEEYHGVKYDHEAVRAAVELSTKHLTDRFLPDKAIDLIDEAGARARLQGQSQIGVGDMETLVASIARIPPRSVSTDQKSKLQNLERDLKLTIFGQDHAIEALVSAIQLSRSGLRSGEKPVGSFLMCGPTGVGKTELTKQLALSMGISFLRFDMSEYSERHTVSRLIGAPPGYVGFDQQGMLTGAVLKQPHAVVLLDEIEKAHPEIWNILLQVMDHGTLTDNNGRKVDFRNVILVMTSNVGSRDIERRGLGIGQASSTNESAAQKAVEREFSPEFRNRLDAIVYFHSLDPVTIANIVGKQLIELESQLLARQVEITVDAAVREWLAEKGYDRQLGARPMQRLIQDKLKKPLANAILFGELEHGGTVSITMKNGEPAFEFQGSTRPGVGSTEAATKTPHV